MRPKSISWNFLVHFLYKKGLKDEIIIAPEVLLHQFPKLYPYQILKDLNFNLHLINYIIFHKKHTHDLTNDYIKHIKQNYKPIWGYRSFIVYKRNPTKGELFKAKFYSYYTSINLDKYMKPKISKKTGILITTYNRPNDLLKLLTQLKNRKEEILVINDGSNDQFFNAYQKIKNKYPNITYIDNPRNIGLVFSLNTGFSYFLADIDIEWVHYIQDDVILEPSFFDTLNKIADKEKHPVLTGMYRTPHKIIKKTTINNIPVYLLHSAPAQHFMLHRQYLQDNLPIPTPYNGAPKKNKGKQGQGADEDWWLISWSPNSIIKQGGYIVSIPNLSSTDMSSELSTWDY